jgi:AcrR family transcriptional regulator
VGAKASSPRAPSNKAVRQRILTAARQHFFAQGFRTVTMDDLARAMGMSKKTLYAQFPSKRALLEAVILEKFRAVEADLNPISSAAPADFAAALHRLLACIQRHLDEIRPPFLRDVQREAPDLFEMVEGRRRKLIQRHLGRLLAKGRRQGLVRKDVPLHLVMEILLAAVRAIINPTRLLELRLTPERGMTAVMSVILHGGLTRQGRSKR